jgi:hypothetical protein
MMTDVKRLLDEASPIPWSQPHPPTIEAATIRHIIREHGNGPQIANTILAEDAALIVHAVNHLPDYEAAVDALERLLEAHDSYQPGSVRALEQADEFEAAEDNARAALRRLRGES